MGYLFSIKIISLSLFHLLNNLTCIWVFNLEDILSKLAKNFQEVKDKVIYISGCLDRALD